MSSNNNNNRNNNHHRPNNSQHDSTHNNNINNNNSNNNDNDSLLQQLLNRLRQAHESIDLDPAQGQFLIDASGGDLDLAVGLYWEDSVAHAARGNNGNNNNNNNDMNQNHNENNRNQIQNHNEINNNNNIQNDSKDNKKTINNNNNNNNNNQEATVAAAAIAFSSPTNQQSNQSLSLNQVHREVSRGRAEKSNFASASKSFNNNNNDDNPKKVVRFLQDDNIANYERKIEEISSKRKLIMKDRQQRFAKKMKNDDENLKQDSSTNNNNNDNNNNNQDDDMNAQLPVWNNDYNINQNNNNNNINQNNNNNNIDDDQAIDASNVSDDEIAAVALAERIWNQFNHHDMCAASKKEIIQKMTRKMTRRRKKNRIKSRDNDVDMLFYGHNKLMALLDRDKTSKDRQKKKRQQNKYGSADDFSSDKSDDDDDDEHEDHKNNNNDTKLPPINLAKNKVSKKSFNARGNFTLKTINDLMFNQNNLQSKKHKTISTTSPSSLSGNHNTISDQEKVSIDDFKYAFILSTQNSVKPSNILWGSGKNSDNDKTVDKVPSQNIDDGDSNENADDDIIMKGEDDDKQECSDDNKDRLDVVSNGDGNEDDNDDEEDDSKENADMLDALIPRTWLSAGFELSQCGTGLVLSRPDDMELMRLKSIQSERFSKVTNSTPLPPYHCGGITILLSIVTALLYTGASIQGNEVNCNSCRKKPFADLSVDERKKQFPERLSDALAALLFNAAKESTEHRCAIITDVQRRLRKKRQDAKIHKYAADIYDSEDDDPNSIENDLPGEDCELMMKQIMQHKVQLCQVCHWEVDKVSGEFKVPLSQLVDKVEKLSLSRTMTNSRDLRSFVSANIRSFMGPGGCALFLETLIHIYGIPRLTRFLEKSKKGCLVQCNCEDRVVSKWEEALNKHQKEKASVFSVTHPEYKRIPPGYNCIKSELLGLILTGKPQKSLDNISTEKLGFGLLSGEDENSYEGSDQQKLPPSPIWVMKGSSSYSVLWNNDAMSRNQNTRSEKQSLHLPFHLSFWNPWYDPVAKRFDGKIVPERIPSSRITHSMNKDMVQMEKSEHKMEVIAHPEDQKFYENYHHWRFNVSPISTNGNDTVMKERSWTSFFRLSKEEKKLVDMKMAPGVNRAIWALWPGSEIEWSPSSKLIS